MMKAIKTFKIGSSYFFDEFGDYVLKDSDELNIMDEFIVEGNVLNTKKGGRDIFFYRQLDKDTFIEDTLGCGVPMRAGKFLIPEFAEYLGMTVNDLKKLKPAFDRMDEKHTYEKIIYDAYLENGGFFLTDKQLNEAYEEYKKRRPEIYS